MTAYIKMIDIWMIFAMIYPFCVVTLYSMLEFLKGQDQNVPVAMKIEKKTWKIKEVVNFLLDTGLPAIVLIFIIFFWTLGIININSQK